MSGDDKVKSQFISQKEISNLINALKMQHEFLNETESTYELYTRVKARAEAFYQYEFCSGNEGQEPNGVVKEQSKAQTPLAYCVERMTELVFGKEEDQNA